MMEMGTWMRLRRRLMWKPGRPGSKARSIEELVQPGPKPP
jgi:hypothetical protein